MPRVDIPVTQALGSRWNAGNVLPIVTFVNGDPTNDHQVRLAPGMLLVAWNSSPTTPFEIAIVSTNDPFRRIESILESIPGPSTRIYGPFDLPGWAQPDGMLHVNLTEAGATLVKLAVIQT